MKFGHLFFGLLLLWNVVAVAAVRKAEDDAKVLEQFAAAIRENSEFTAETREKALATLELLKGEEGGPSLAITEALTDLYPNFRQGINALAEENLEVATGSLQELVDAADPWLAAEARYFMARVHLIQERYEESLPLLESLDKKFTGRTVHVGDALFLRGVALGQMLRRTDAVKTLEKYLAEHPEAPERMRIGAWRQIEQLKMIQEGTLSDAQFRMDFSRRRLALDDSGDQLQTEQKKIVSILDVLIKEAEEKECNCKGGGKSKGKKQGKAGENKPEGEKPGESQGGNSGGGSKGTDSDTVERLHRGGPQSPWSKLRDKDRDPVFNAIKEKFPGRYQQLIEQYYKSFEEESEG